MYDACRAAHRGTWRDERGRPKPLPAVAALDAFFQRYGWTYADWLSTPAFLIDELHQVIKAESDHMAEQQRERDKQALKSGVSLPKERVDELLEQRSTDDLLREAAAQGFGVPG